MSAAGSAAGFAASARPKKLKILLKLEAIKPDCCEAAVSVVAAVALAVSAFALKTAVRITNVRNTKTLAFVAFIVVTPVFEDRGGDPFRALDDIFILLKTKVFVIRICC